MAQEKKEWIVRINNQSFGPYTGSQLKQLAQQGKITPQTQINRANTDQWYQAKQLKGIFPSPSEPTAQPATPSPNAAQNQADPLDLNHLNLDDVIMSDPALPPQQPVKPRPKNQVKKVVTRAFPVSPLLLNMAAYLLLGLGFLTLLGAIGYMVGTLAVESAVSTSTLDMFSNRGPFFIFRVVSGVASFLQWALVIGIAIVMGLIWQESNSDKVTPPGYAIAIIAGPILSVILSFGGCAISMFALSLFVILIPLIYLLFYGFMIPQALLLGHWQTYTNQVAIKNVHYISCGITGGALLLHVMGYLTAFFAPAIVSTLAIGIGMVAYSGAAAFLGYAFLMFVKKISR